MNSGKRGGSEERQSVDFEAFGKAVVEEVLFRAGLEVADASVKVEKAIAALQFQISVTEAEKSMEVEFERVNSAPLKLQIQL